MRNRILTCIFNGALSGVPGGLIWFFILPAVFQPDRPAFVRAAAFAGTVSPFVFLSSLCYIQSHGGCWGSEDRIFESNVFGRLRFYISAFLVMIIFGLGVFSVMLLA